jgi:hypothetical protein
MVSAQLIEIPAPLGDQTVKACCAWPPLPVIAEARRPGRLPGCGARSASMLTTYRFATRRNVEPPPEVGAAHKTGPAGRGRTTVRSPGLSACRRLYARRTARLQPAGCRRRSGEAGFLPTMGPTILSTGCPGDRHAKITTGSRATFAGVDGAALPMRPVRGSPGPARSG